MCAPLAIPETGGLEAGEMYANNTQPGVAFFLVAMVGMAEDSPSNTPTKHAYHTSPVPSAIMVLVVK